MLLGLDARREHITRRTTFLKEKASIRENYIFPENNGSGILPKMKLEERGLSIWPSTSDGFILVVYGLLRCLNLNVVHRLAI